MESATQCLDMKYGLIQPTKRIPSSGTQPTFPLYFKKYAFRKNCDRISQPSPYHLPHPTPGGRFSRR
jgi:hypothetical protein